MGWDNCGIPLTVLAPNIVQGTVFEQKTTPFVCLVSRFERKILKLSTIFVKFSTIRPLIFENKFGVFLLQKVLLLLKLLKEDLLMHF